MIRRVAAEFLGTFFLVFAGTGAVVVNDTAPGHPVTHVGVALTFGLVVLAMVSAFGDVSGAHLNPAVSVGFWFAGRFPARDVVPYCLAQCAGALAASGLLAQMFPEHVGLGVTVPLGSHQRSFVLEVVLTAALMYVALAVSTGPKEKGLMAGIAVGAVVALEALFGGPISGASMNPARSLGPAVVSQRTPALDSLWVYLLAPPLGAVAAVMVGRGVLPPPAKGENP
jgi:aquaporin Z